MVDKIPSSIPDRAFGTDLQAIENANQDSFLHECGNKQGSEAADLTSSVVVVDDDGDDDPDEKAGSDDNDDDDDDSVDPYSSLLETQDWPYNPSARH